MTFASLVKKHKRATRAMREHARPAHVWLQTSGVGAHQRARVLVELARNPSGLTRNELARNLQLPINAVCGRIDELLSESLVIRGPPRESTVSGRVNETFIPRGIKIAPQNATHEPAGARQTMLEGWA